MLRFVTSGKQWHPHLATHVLNLHVPGITDTSGAMCQVSQISLELHRRYPSLESSLISPLILRKYNFKSVRTQTAFKSSFHKAPIQWARRWLVRCCRCEISHHHHYAARLLLAERRQTSHLPGL